MNNLKLKNVIDRQGNFKEQGMVSLRALAEIVANKHFSYVNATDREDLKDVGVLKALEMLKDGSFDETRSSLKNYLYTGMRNEMKNYLYRISREMLMEDEILLMKGDKGIEDINFTVTDDDIRDTLGILLKDNLDKIKQYLVSMGFVVEGEVEGRVNKEVEKEICLIVWSLVK